MQVAKIMDKTKYRNRHAMRQSELGPHLLTHGETEMT